MTTSNISNANLFVTLLTIAAIAGIDKEKSRMTAAEFAAAPHVKFEGETYAVGGIFKNEDGVAEINLFYDLGGLYARTTFTFAADGCSECQLPQDEVTLILRALTGALA